MTPQFQHIPAAQPGRIVIEPVRAASCANYSSNDSSSPSEDYLTAFAGQRQWIATTNCAGCPGQPPGSFANSAALTTSAIVPDA